MIDVVVDRITKDNSGLLELTVNGEPFTAIAGKQLKDWYITRYIMTALIRSQSHWELLAFLMNDDWFSLLFPTGEEIADLIKSEEND